MASQFLIDGDLFVEVVDNDDGGGFPQKRVDELSQANRKGRFDDIAFPFERANGYNGVPNSTAAAAHRRTSSGHLGQAASILSSFMIGPASP